MYLQGGYEVDVFDPYLLARNHLVDPARKSTPVKMRIQDTVHYQINSTDSDDDFSFLLPPSGHFVFGKEDPIQHHTVALFHQLRCLDTIRRDYGAGQGATAAGKHCMNYLRQSILCLADTKLEPVRNPYGPQYVFLSHVYGNRAQFCDSTVVFLSDYTCHDWNTVYDAAHALNSQCKSSFVSLKRSMRLNSIAESICGDHVDIVVYVNPFFAS